MPPHRHRPVRRGLPGALQAPCAEHPPRRRRPRGGVSAKHNGLRGRAEIPTFWAYLRGARKMISFSRVSAKKKFKGFFFPRVSAKKKMVLFFIFVGVLVLLGGVFLRSLGVFLFFARSAIVFLFFVLLDITGLTIL